MGGEPAVSAALVEPMFEEEEALGHGEMALIEKEPSELLATVANDADAGAVGKHWDAAIAAREGQMGGHDRERGRGVARPLDTAEATAARSPNVYAAA